MTQNERTAYNNGFAIGMTIGINARKDPFRILYAAKLLEATTGEMPVLHADTPISIENSESTATGDTPAIYAAPPVYLRHSLSIPTGTTPCEPLDVPVFFGTTILLEDI